MIFVHESHKNKGLYRFLKSLTIENKFKFVLLKDLNDINNYESEIGIFGGFLPHEKVIIENVSIRNKYYTFCSPFGQADLSSSNFISTEIFLMSLVRDLIYKGVYKNVITPSKSLSSRFDFIYIPPVCDLENRVPVDISKRQNFGFLGNNYRKHKNIVNQLAAISKLAEFPKQRIVVDNAENYKFWGDFFDCEFISKDLTEDKDYFTEISSHLLGFQCSWSEAFDYQAFEYCAYGVPVIVGPCIDWINNEDLMVKNPDDWYEIYWKAKQLLGDKDKYINISRYFFNDHFEMLNNRNKEYLLRVIKKEFK